jgi:hypothetical protein
MNRTIITLAAIATLVIAAIGGAAAASAATAADYRQALTDAGYTVSSSTTGAGIKHPTLHAGGETLTATKGGQSVTLEVIEYASRAQLKEDFAAANGSGPKPAAATTDFDGRVLYWNENMILAVSFRAPNEPGLARAAADIFLGRRGTGGPDAGASTGATGGTGTATGTSTGTKLPAAGSGGYLQRSDSAAGAEGGLSSTVIAAAIAGAMVTGTGLAVAARRRARA